MDIIVAGTRNGLLMVEGETKFISEADVLAALKFGHQNMMPMLNAQDELREKTGSKPTGITTLRLSRILSVSGR